MQAKVFNRTHAKDICTKRMECEKPDSFENDCQLQGCRVCVIDDEVDLLHQMVVSLRSKDRDVGDAERAIEQLEICCNEGKTDPLILISNDKWIKSFTIIAMESLR